MFLFAVFLLVASNTAPPAPASISLGEQTKLENNTLFNKLAANRNRTPKVVGEKLKYTESGKMHLPENSNFCPPAFDGVLPNPRDCRTFYNCADGNGSQLECSDHLVFNELTDQCDYPEDADCCEHPQVDNNKLVYDLILI